MFCSQYLNSTACCDLEFDLQNLIRSLVAAVDYSLLVMSQFFKAFMRYIDLMTELSRYTCLA